MGSDLLRCDNSSKIMLYHGIKDQNVLDRVIDYMNNKDENVKWWSHVKELEVNVANIIKNNTSI
jgi:hypothetical protein